MSKGQMKGHDHESNCFTVVKDTGGNVNNYIDPTIFHPFMSNNPSLSSNTERSMVSPAGTPMFSSTSSSLGPPAMSTLASAHISISPRLSSNVTPTHAPVMVGGTTLLNASNQQNLHVNGQGSVVHNTPNRTHEPIHQEKGAESNEQHTQQVHQFQVQHIQELQRQHMQHVPMPQQQLGQKTLTIHDQQQGQQQLQQQLGQTEILYQDEQQHIQQQQQHQLLQAHQIEKQQQFHQEQLQLLKQSRERGQTGNSQDFKMPIFQQEHNANQEQLKHQLRHQQQQHHDKQEIPMQPPLTRSKIGPETMRSTKQFILDTLAQAQAQGHSKESTLMALKSSLQSNTGGMQPFDALVQRAAAYHKHKKDLSSGITQNDAQVLPHQNSSTRSESKCAVDGPVIEPSLMNNFCPKESAGMLKTASQENQKSTNQLLFDPRTRVGNISESPPLPIQSHNLSPNINIDNIPSPTPLPSLGLSSSAESTSKIFSDVDGTSRINTQCNIGITNTTLSTSASSLSNEEVPPKERKFSSEEIMVLSSLSSKPLSNSASAREKFKAAIAALQVPLTTNIKNTNLRSTVGGCENMPTPSTFQADINLKKSNVEKEQTHKKRCQPPENSFDTFNQTQVNLKKLRTLDNKEQHFQQSTISSEPEQSPADFVKSILAQGQNQALCPSQHDSFFTRPSQTQIDAYDSHVVAAVRKRDVDVLRKMISAGRTLDCSNRFGESLLHMACRRGYVDVVSVLVNEAMVSVRVRDDYGRTPMHDACWTSSPNLQLMDVLMKRDPEMLLVKDVRGHTPFDYARKEHWNCWLDFLRERRDWLRQYAAAKSDMALRNQRPSIAGNRTSLIEIDNIGINGNVDTSGGEKLADEENKNEICSQVDSSSQSPSHIIG